MLMLEGLCVWVLVGWFDFPAQRRTSIGIIKHSSPSSGQFAWLNVVYRSHRLNIFLQSGKVITHCTFFDCVLNMRYVLPVAMHLVRALTNALNSVVYSISAIHSSSPQDASFNRSMVYMHGLEIIHLDLLRSEGLKSMVSCWDHRPKGQGTQQ